MKVYLFILALISTLSLVSGCASSEQIQAQQRQYALEREQQERQRMNDHMKKCDGYGFTRGTTAFAQCLQQAEQQASTDRAFMMQQIQIQEENNRRQWQKVQCYSTGRLDC